MTDLQLYTKISTLSPDLKKEVEDFIDSLKAKSSATSSEEKGAKKKRSLGKGIGTVIIKDNFDDPLEEFKDYM